MKLGTIALVALGWVGSAAAGEKTFYELFLNPEFAKPVAPDMPFRGKVEAHLAPGLLPATFQPLPDGRVQLLDAGAKRLLTVRDGTLVREVTLAGGEFVADEAQLIDFLPTADGGALVLDANHGCLWAVDPAGRVVGRHGLLVGPTGMSRASDGRIYVADPGSRSVVVYSKDLEPRAARRGLGLSPFATRDGLVPFVDIDPLYRGVLVGLVPVEGETPSAASLAKLAPPEGMNVVDARVVGVTDTELYVAVLANRTGDENPRDTSIHAVGLAGAARGTVRRIPVPTLPNYCMDCGPEYRIDPTGRIWAWVMSKDGYRVLTLASEGTGP